MGIGQLPGGWPGKKAASRGLPLRPNVGIVGSHPVRYAMQNRDRDNNGCPQRQALGRNVSIQYPSSDASCPPSRRRSPMPIGTAEQHMQADGEPDRHGIHITGNRALRSGQIPDDISMATHRDREAYGRRVLLLDIRHGRTRRSAGHDDVTMPANGPAQARKDKVARQLA